MISVEPKLRDVAGSSNGMRFDRSLHLNTYQSKSPEIQPAFGDRVDHLRRGLERTIAPKFPTKSLSHTKIALSLGTAIGPTHPLPSSREIGAVGPLPVHPTRLASF